MEVAIKGAQGVGIALNNMRANLIRDKIYIELKFKSRRDKPHKEKSAKKMEASFRSRLRQKKRLIYDALTLHSLGV